MNLKDALTACEKDVMEEATNSEELIITAEENLKSILEALLFPILDSEGYSIGWT